MAKIKQNFEIQENLIRTFCKEMYSYAISKISSHTNLNILSDNDSLEGVVNCLNSM